MALPNPGMQQPGDQMNASQMLQYQQWTAKEAIKTAFSASVLSMQSNLLSKSLLRIIPGSGILKDRADVKKRELFEKQGRDADGRKLSKQEFEEREKKRKDLGALGTIKDIIVDQWAQTGVPLGPLLDIDTKFLLERMDANLLLTKISLEKINENVEAIKKKFADDAEDAFGKKYTNSPASGLLNLTPESTEEQQSASEKSSLAQQLEEANLEKEGREEDVRLDEHVWWLTEFTEGFIKQMKAAGLGGGGATGGAGGGGGLMETIKNLATAYLAKDLLKNIGGKALNGIKSAGKSVFDGIKSAGKSVFRGISSVGSSLMKNTGVGKTLTMAAEEAGSLGGRALEGVKSVGGRALGAVQSAGSSVLKTGGKALGAVKSAGSSVLKAGGNLISKATGAIGGSAGGLFGKVGGFLGSVAAKLNPMKSLGAFIKTSGGKILKGITSLPGIASLMEGAMAAYDIKGIKDNPDLSMDEKRKEIGSRLSQALGSVLGGLGGGALGTLLPIPGIGTILGTMGGSYLGGWLAEQLADVLGPEKIYDAVRMIPGLGSLVSVDENTEQMASVSPTANLDSAKKSINEENETRRANGQPELTGQEVTQRMSAAQTQDQQMGTATGTSTDVSAIKPPTGADIPRTSSQNEAMKLAPTNNTSVNSTANSVQQNNNTVIASPPTTSRTGADTPPRFNGSLAFA